MIICSTTLISLIFINYKREQIESIKEILIIINLMKKMLSRGYDTDKITERIKGENLKNFDTENNRVKYIDMGVQDDFIKLFDMLGKTDTESQISVINSALDEYLQIRNEYENYYQSHAKIYIALGVCSGILLCVLIM